MYLALRKGEKSDLAGDKAERVTGVTSVASGCVVLLTFWSQFLLSRKAEPKETESHGALAKPAA